MVAILVFIKYNNGMKKFAAFIIFLAVLLSFAGCKGKGVNYNLELSFDEITYFSNDSVRALKISSTDTFLYYKTDSDKEVYFSSSDDTIVGLGEKKTNGIYLKTLKTGTAVISASLKGTPKKISVTLTVAPSSGDILTLSPKNITEAYIGYERVLSCMLDNVTVSNELVTFSSSFPDIVGVDTSGKVKILKEGSAIITASYSGLSALCTVTTNKESPRFWLSADRINLSVGQTYDIISGITIDTDYVTATPSFYFQSTDIKIVSISASGIASALKSGTVTVYVTNSFNNEVLFLAIIVD